MKSRKCAVCGKATGAITGFRTMLKLFGFKPEDGYAHEKCIRKLQKKVSKPEVLNSCNPFCKRCGFRVVKVYSPAEGASPWTPSVTGERT